MMELLEQRADGNLLCRAIWARRKAGPWAEALADLAGVLESDLDWLGDEERGQVQYAAGTSIQELLTSWRPENLRAGKVVLDAFAKWMGALEEHQLLDVCWELLAFERKHDGNFDDCSIPVHAVRRMGRLTGALGLESLELALALADEAENMYWWPDTRWALADWARDSAPYFQALEHGSYVVRVWAAKAIGRMHAGLRRRDSRELMEWFGALEARSPGVCGAFLHGAEWGFGDGPLDCLDEGFLRSWFLDALRSGGEEPMVPHVISLEFHAHEYFSYSEYGIREMLRMGRKRLALETATENPEAIEVLRELLEELAQSDDPQISRTIQTYLRERWHHAGMETW